MPLFPGVLWGLFFLTGSSLSDQITQIPTQAHYKPEETAEIKCSHSISSYNTVLWYRQTRDQQLQFLGYLIAASPFPESGLGLKLGGSAEEGRTSTLTIAGLSLADSGLYYCAAKTHSRWIPQLPSTKTPANQEPPLLSSHHRQISES